MTCSSVEEERMTTFTSGYSLRIRVRQESPSAPGIRRSRSTMSGLVRPTIGRTCVPDEHSPTISKSPASSSARRTPSMISRWSSARRTRMHAILAPRPSAIVRGESDERRTRRASDPCSHRCRAAADARAAPSSARGRRALQRSRDRRCGRGGGHPRASRRLSRQPQEPQQDPGSYGDCLARAVGTGDRPHQPAGRGGVHGCDARWGSRLPAPEPRSRAAASRGPERAARRARRAPPFRGAAPRRVAEPDTGAPDLCSRRRAARSADDSRVGGRRAASARRFNGGDRERARHRAGDGATPHRLDRAENRRQEPRRHVCAFSARGRRLPGRRGARVRSRTTERVQAKRVASTSRWYGARQGSPIYV